MSLMPHSFPGSENSAEVVGRTPWSARDAHVPLLARRIKTLSESKEPPRGSAADPGVRPTMNADVWKWENYAVLGSSLPHLVLRVTG